MNGILTMSAKERKILNILMVIEVYRLGCVSSVVIVPEIK
jgi:hypothetical protein